MRGASPAGWQFHRLLWPKGIATRLYAVFALGVSIVLVLALAAIIFASQTRTAALGFFSDGLTGIAAATDLDILLKRHRRMVETIPDEPAVNIAAPRRRVLDDLAAEITALLDGDAQHELAGVRADAGRLISEGYHVLALAEAGETASLKHYVDIYSGVAARMQEGLDSYRSGRLAEAEAGIAELAASARSLLAWVLICSVTLVVIVAPASFLVVVGMVRRLKVVAGAMLKLARNEMEIRLDVGDDNDEITEMARAVNVFKANALSLLDHKSEVERLNAWLEIAVNNMSRGLSLFDCDQRLLICNHEYRDMYGLTDELVARGTRFQDIVRHRLEVGTGREGDVDGFDLLHSPLIQRPEGASADFVTLTHRLANGRIIQVAFQGVKDGGWVAVHEDITEKQAKADRIEEMARKDPLTGLGNRRHFHEEMEKACAGLAAGKPFAVHWIDLDRFKLVNDTLGHQIGDQLLQAAATRMERALRAEDFIARLGGDEFVILQREDVSEDTAGILAARLVATLGRPFFIDGHKIDIGGTVGVALGPKHGTKPDILLRCADQALYQAKANGRGQHIIFETPAAAA